MGGFSYPEHFIFEPDLIPGAVGAGALGIFVVVYLLIIFAALAFFAVSYVFYSLGLYTIANRRGIRHSWLAWVPVGNLWILGSISDQYRYVAKGKVTNCRKLLPGFGIGLTAGYILWLFVTLFNLAAGNEGLALLLLILGGLVILAAAIWLAVCQYMAYYDLYRSCEPDNGVLFLVLSIVFSAAMPFFVFACRKKDLGMPPRKQPAAQQVVVPTVEVVVDPNIVEKVVVPTVEPVIEEGFAQPEEFEE